MCGFNFELLVLNSDQQKSMIQLLIWRHWHAPKSSCSCAGYQTSWATAQSPAASGVNGYSGTTMSGRHSSKQLCRLDLGQ